MSTVDRTSLSAVLQQAMALHRQGEFVSARAMYARILRAQPTHFDALHLSGVIALQMNDPKLALKLIGKAIDANPKSPAALCNLGSAFEALDQLENALTSFEQAASIEPDHVESLFNHANVMFKLKRYESAAAGFNRVITLKPGLADAHFNRGKALRHLSRAHEAKGSLDEAIRLQPNHVGAYISRGLLFKELNQLDAALASYDRAIAINPNNAAAHSNRGNVLKELNRWDAALASYDRATAIDSGFAEAHFNRGVLLHDLGRLDEAVSSYDKAIAGRSDYADALGNRGNAFTELNRLGDALVDYQDALKVNPSYAAAHFNNAIALLLAGDFDGGWQEYEWRWKNEGGSVFNERRQFDRPLWVGQKMTPAATLFLYGEQGLGDVIQFCRYAALAAGLGVKVILEVRAPLVDLLSRLDGVSRLIAKGDDIPQHDYQCPLMSLPLAFKTANHTIPFAHRYLAGEPAKIETWRERLGSGLMPRIGLAWSGNPKQRNDLKRSIPLASLMTALPHHFQYVCLQTEVRDSDRETLMCHPNMLFFGEDMSFEAAAAVCECLDLVISVDTSIAHLSAALGRPTWILLPFNPDWRWQLDRADSPWYSSARLYRQRVRGEWASVFEQVTRDLTESFSTSRQPY